MRRLALLIFFLPILGFGQEGPGVPQSDAFHHYLALYASHQEASDLTGAALKLVEKLESKRSDFNDDRDFLRYLFDRNQSQVLKNFVPYTTFNDLLRKGQYNCLTATAWYALLLEHFGFEYQITETNYHIFLLVQLDGKSILLETTDSENGFVDQASDIEDRIHTYRKNEILTSAKDKDYYAFDFDLYKTVSLAEMTGLLEYNQAVKAYNKHQLGESIAFLNKASEVYQSPRMEGFSRILLLSVAESSLDNDVKKSYITQLQVIRRKQSNVLASASQN